MPALSGAAQSVWAKSPRNSLEWLPLWQHLDDSAAVAGRLWDEWLSDSVRRAVSASLPAGESDGRRLVAWLAGVHDIGKATPAFAVRVHGLAERMRDLGLAMPQAIPYQDRKLALHATAGQLLLEDWLVRVHGWEPMQARPYAIVVGGHHGVPPGDMNLFQAAERPALLGLSGNGRDRWRTVHDELLAWAAIRHGVTDRLPQWRQVRLTQTAQVLVTGLIIVADWIASNEDLFSYEPATFGVPARVDEAWTELDLPAPWRALPPAATMDELLAERFSLPADAVARPVQVAAVDLARQMPGNGLLIIEAPMGEGKTEAALVAAELLAARTGAGGVFVALPTRATSDAMFLRVLNWLRHVPDADRGRGALAVTLAHGKARLNQDFRALMRGRSVAVNEDEREGAMPCQDLASHRWLSGRKKAMLSSFVVGTIDQLLFAGLRSRHLALRHLGLAGKVVIIDEAHAYDVYMSEYLDRVLEWLAAYGVPTIVLSATLPASRRKAMIQAYDRGRAPGAAQAQRRRSWRDQSDTPAVDPYQALDGDIGYPVLVATGEADRPIVATAAPSGRETTVALENIEDSVDGLATRLRQELAGGGCALVVCNTVRRVQETADQLRVALAPIEVSVAHSRFLAPDRAAKDQWLRDSFGPPEHCARVGRERPVSHVVVASQVAEQSLDIDFDLLVTDLAPVDLVLQRMGRLHRHARGKDQRDRPSRLRDPRCLVRGVDWDTLPPTPVNGSRLVYGVHALLRSLAVLRPHLEQREPVRLPSDIAPLVQTAYADAPVGPQSWQPAMREAAQRHQRLREQKRDRASAFRLDPVGPAGEAIVDWLKLHVGDTDDDPKGRAQVRDTGAESVEVLMLVRRSDGVFVTPPWLEAGGGLEVSTEHTPHRELARTIATCTLSLPYELSTHEAIQELERRHDYPTWQHSPWLEGQLILAIDEDGTATLTNHDLHYDPSNGLRTMRAVASIGYDNGGGHDVV